MNGALFLLSLKNVLRGRSRALLCVVAVSVGIAALTLLYALGTGGQTMAMSYLRGFGFSGSLIIPNVSTAARSPLYAEDADYVQRTVEGVAQAIAFSTRYGTMRAAGYADDAVVWGVGRDVQDFIGVKLLYGRFFSGSDMENAGRVMLIDSACAMDAFGRENAVGRTLEVNVGGVSEPFTVVGVVAEGMATLSAITGGQTPSFVFVPHSAMESLSGSGGASQLCVHFEPGANAARTAEGVCRALSLRHEGGVGYSVQDMDGYMSGAENVMELLRLLVLSAAAVSLLVSGIGVMNAMLSAVKERRREIGLCLAIGATPRQIAAGFVLEAVWISVLGGAAGAAAGLGLAFVCTRLLGLPFSVGAAMLLAAQGAVVVTGLIFGTVPALRAARLAPMDTLREE